MGGQPKTPIVASIVYGSTIAPEVKLPQDTAKGISLPVKILPLHFCYIDQHPWRLANYSHLFALHLYFQTARVIDFCTKISYKTP